MIELRLGDLFDAGKQVLAHQVNTRGAFGGLAQSVFERYPFSYSQCVALCKDKTP